MIDQCILEVYQRDNKVFLPEFGAIIYSDFNDSVDFNDLLTFDDGKVVEEIQKQQSISEDEARNALEAYIQSIKDTLGLGKLHFFSGIGYLSVDEQGSYSIEKTAPVVKTAAKKKPTAKKPSSTDKKSAAPDKKSKPKADEKITSDKKEEEAKIAAVSEAETTKDSFKSEIVEEETYVPDFVEEQTPVVEATNQTEETEYNVEEPAFSSFTSENDSFKEYDEDFEVYGEKDKKRSSKKLLWAILIFVLVTIGGFYLYNHFSSQTEADDRELVSSDVIEDENTEEPIETIQDQNEPPQETKAVENDPVPIVPESVAIEPGDEDKTFCLILGSFKVESNADKYQRQLERKGLESNKFKGRRNFYFVGIESIKGKSSAVRQLTEIQKTVPSAWIFNKELLLKI